jgi:nucleoside-diphosphate-sugar epimerase
MDSTQRVFITGGAGFLGINLIRHLLRRGYEITSFDKAEFDYPERYKVRVVRGDIRDEKQLAAGMLDCSLVVHCAAALPLYSRQDILSTDIDGTRNVLQVAHEHGVHRVVHVSSTAVYGIPDHHPLLENDKLEGVGPYGIAKVEAENVCLEFRAKGMCISIIRPKSFVGPERLGVFALFYEWAKDGKNFPMIGRGDNRYQLLDVEDLCEAIFLCLTDEKTKVNDIFNIGAKIYTTMKQDYQAVLDQAGFGKRIIGFPAGPVIWTLRFLELLHLSPLYKWVYETASKDSFVSIEKAERVLGFSPKHSNQDALVRNYQWYLAHVNDFQNVTGISHRAPWKQGILRLFKVFF